MGKPSRKRFKPRVKFQAVMELLQGTKTTGELARVYRVHPITLGQWKKELLEKGPEVFGGGDDIQTYEKRIRELQRLLGQKEVEIAVLKNFLDES